MTPAFKPVVYLKDGCPFCFKFRVALLEMGSIDQVEIRTFSAGAPEEADIRERLAGRIQKVSFPAVEISSGEIKTESDDLIAHFAGQKNIDPQTLATLQAYISGPFAKLMKLARENREPSNKASA